MSTADQLTDLAERATTAIANVSSRPIGDCDRAGLDAVLAELRCVRAFCDTVDVQVARRGRHLAAEGRSAGPADVLGEQGRRSRRDAEAAAGREQVCERQPGLETALGNGSVSTGHLDAIANATASLTDEQRQRFDEHAAELAERAANESVEAFARRCRHVARHVCGDEGESRLNNQRSRNSVRHWVDKDTGMYHIHAELDPETGAKVVTVLTAHINTLKHRDRRPSTPTADTDDAPADVADGDEPDDDEQAPNPVAARLGAELAARIAEARGDTPPPSDPMPTTEPPEPQSPPRSPDTLAAEAFVELLTGAQSVDRRLPEVSVLIDLETLLHGLHDNTVCETSTGTLLPPETIRRLACQGDLVPIVLGSAGDVLDVGRAQRLATPAQRRALRAMYTTCAYPGCRVVFDRCEIHHVHPWLTGGRSDLANLIPVCSHHHHLIHEGGWTLALRPDRTITVTRPDGAIDFRGTSINRHPPPKQPAA